MIFLTIIAFVVIFSVLILVHEFGHFFMARKAGIKVEEFGIGLPPRIKTLFKDKKGTMYSLNWIPFGGFVRLFGEDAVDEKILKNKNSFASKSIFRRTLVILAGVFMNMVLAWVIITIGFSFGMKPFLVTQDDLQKGIDSGIVETQQVLYVHEIVPGSPISKSDLAPGDLIVEIDGQAMPAEADKFQDFLAPDKNVNLKILRGEKEGMLNVTADSKGELGITFSTEQIVLNVKNVKYPFYIAPLKAASEVGRLSVLTVQMLGQVVVSLVAKLTVPEGVAGPVGIAKMTHYFVQQGFMAVLQFTALISISLGVINAMPFPALDGGRFLFIVYEIITRRKANAKMESVIHSIGFALLMLLIVVITWHDIVNLF